MVDVVSLRSVFKQVVKPVLKARKHFTRSDVGNDPTPLLVNSMTHTRNIRHSVTSSPPWRRYSGMGDHRPTVGFGVGPSSTKRSTYDISLN